MADSVWLSRRISHGNTTALIRLEQRDGRWTTTALLLFGDDINSNTLKKVPAAVPVQMDDPVYAAEVVAAQSAETECLAGLLRKAMAAAPVIEPVAPQEPSAFRPRLCRPDGSNPDGHAKAVAVAYREYVAAWQKPGPSIAAEASVPVATARGWIQEARRRGHLRPGRKGRAGG